MEGRPHGPGVARGWGGVFMCGKGGGPTVANVGPRPTGGPANHRRRTHGFLPSKGYGGPTVGPNMQEDPRSKNRRAHGYGHGPGPTSPPANHRGGPTVSRTRRGGGPTVPTSNRRRTHGRKTGGPTVTVLGRGPRVGQPTIEEDPRFPVLAREGGPRFPPPTQEDPRSKNRRAHGHGHRPGPTSAPANHRGGPTVPRTRKGGGPTVPTSNRRRTHGRKTGGPTVTVLGRGPRVRQLAIEEGPRFPVLAGEGGPRFPLRTVGGPTVEKQEDPRSRSSARAHERASQP